MQSFLLDWENGQYAAAAALTTGAPAQVAAALQDAYQQVGAADLTLAMLSVTQRGDTARGDASTRTSTSAAAARRGTTTVPSGCAGRAPAGRWCGPRPSSFPGCGPGCASPWSARMPPRAQLLDARGNPARPALPGLHRRRDPRPPGPPGPDRERPGQRDRAGREPGPELDRRGAVRRVPRAGPVQPGGYHRLSARLSRVPGLIIERQRLRLFDSIAPAVSGSVGSEAAKELQDGGDPVPAGHDRGPVRAAADRSSACSSARPPPRSCWRTPAGQVVSVLTSWPGQSGTDVRTTINAQRAGRGRQRGGFAGRARGDRRDRAVHRPRPRRGPAHAPRHAVGAARSTGRLPARPGVHDRLGGGAARHRPRPERADSVWPRPTRWAARTSSTTRPSPPCRPRSAADFANACSTAFAGLSLQLPAKKLEQAALGLRPGQAVAAAGQLLRRGHAPARRPGRAGRGLHRRGQRRRSARWTWPSPPRWSSPGPGVRPRW